jgi:hypothetical protein
MKMKTTLSLVAAAVALFSYGAFAQDKSRAEVKEETKKAEKSGQIQAGEATPTPVAKPKSTKARPDVKAETKSEVKAGAIAAGEEAKPGPKPKSTKARPDVKAETKAANKSGEIPTGEAAPKK